MPRSAKPLWPGAIPGRGSTFHFDGDHGVTAALQVVNLSARGQHSLVTRFSSLLRSSTQSNGFISRGMPVQIRPEQIIQRRVGIKAVRRPDTAKTAERYRHPAPFSQPLVCHQRANSLRRSWTGCNARRGDLLFPGRGWNSRHGWLKPIRAARPMQVQVLPPRFLAAVTGISIPGRLKPVRLSVQIRPAAPLLLEH